ncbi:MAG: histidine phosphatase family protein [Rhodobacteraceae bacterium]|nr:MAG: histidine phosphatase family protein [Paracoccaceae bacterium]
MTLRLILTRHAKSDWDNPLLSDHERPLNSRGRRAAPRIGRWLVENDYLPQQALVSDAVRTRETWDLISAQFQHKVKVRFVPAIYQAHGNPDVMLDVLGTAEADTVILIGHNPGIAALAGQLLRERPEQESFIRYPTCATMVAEFEVPRWSALAWRSGALRDFIVPRQLEEG